MQESYKKKIKRLMSDYVHLVYKLTKEFPPEEKFSSVSQWRRAALSMLLNYVEGFARRRPNVQLNFLEISYGSLSESKCMNYFAKREQFMTEEDYEQLTVLIEEIGAMLWTEITKLEKSIQNS